LEAKVVQGHLKNNLVASLKVREHEVISGLSEKLGGHDEGPSPHEFIEAGLAGCTILTCQLYANRKGWPLVSTEVKVEILSETKEKAIFSRQIKFVGDLSSEQKQRLLEIANKCPVHNLLVDAIDISTELVGD
jgi:putative redox protein